MPSISTKTGDDGTTGLMFNRRLSKADLRFDACGSVDELNASLGLARAFAERSEIATELLGIQKELVMLMGEIAILPEDLPKYIAKGFERVDAAMTERLTRLIDALERDHEISYEGWATPGATRGSAFLDQARTVCRRAERLVVTMRESGELDSPEIVRYLNRLSDLCWLYARWTETLAPRPSAQA